MDTLRSADGSLGPDDRLYSMTVEALYGAIAYDARGFSKFPYDDVQPRPPFEPRYVRWRSRNTTALSGIMQYIKYKPHEWFVGEDVVTITLSDGDQSGNKTSQYTYDIFVKQAEVSGLLLFILIDLPIMVDDDFSLIFGVFF